MPKRTAIVFDMDGLMVDSEPLSRRAWDEYLRPYNQRLSDELQSRIIGLRGDQSAALIREEFGLHDTAEKILADRRLIYQRIRAQGVPVMPGLIELHAVIAKRNIPWAVATSSPRDHAEEILEQLGLADAVAAIAAGNEVPHGKPAPDIYQLAAQRLGVSPEVCLALEDSSPGSRAAVAAGMLTVAIPNGETSSSDFSHAHYVYTSLYDVTENLDRLLMQ